MSLSLLFGLLSYWNHTNIGYSSSGWDIFLKFLGDTLRTLIHFFQIILIFLYVCQSISWPTFKLKLDKNWDITSSEWDIFLIFCKHSWDVWTLVPNATHFLASLSVCNLAHILLKVGLYLKISNSIWYIFLIFLGILLMFVNYF